MSENVKINVFYIQDMSPIKKTVTAFSLLEKDGTPSAKIKDHTLQYFLQHEQSIHQQMRTRIYEYYKETRQMTMPYLDALPNINQIYPEIIIGNEIDLAVHLTAMDISRDGKMLRFTYEVDWDVEHGLELIVCSDRVVDIGSAGEVFFK